MSLAENLLNSLDETAYENMRIAGSGEEEHIIVGQDRSITVPNALKTIAVKGDKDVETATIDCVRYWDGHDLSTFAIYLNYILPNGGEGTYIPECISKAEDTFSFDWLIGSEFTYAQGKMTFWIVAKLTDDSGTLIKQWSSFQNSDCTIAQGGDKIYVPEKQTDQDVISQAISISRSSAEIAEQQANLAQQAAGKAASDAKDAAEQEIARIIGELGIVQELGDSPNSVISQAKVTKEFVATNAKIDRNTKRITNIEQGLTPDSFETDDSVAYQKDVPANALPYAEIAKIGGMTYKDGDTLRSAKVTEVKSVGANLLPFPYNQSMVTNNGVTYTVNADGSVLANGTATEYTNAVIYLARDFVLPAGTYTFVFNDTVIRGAVMAVMINGSWFADVSISKIITLKSGDALTIYLQVVGGVSVTNLLLKPRINKGSTARPYTPYVEHTLPIPEAVRPANGINENVYDYIEWAEDGSVKKTVKCGVVDLGTISWTKDTDYGNYYFANISGKKQDVSNNLLCSIYEPTEDYGNNAADMTIRGSAGRELVFVRNNAYTDAATFKAAMSGVMLVYELAEPEVTDISDLITADNLVPVQSGGTLTFENEYGYAVPSEVEYQVEV